MPLSQARTTSDRYARCDEVSTPTHWDIDRDVFRGRDLDIRKKFLPDGLSLVVRLETLNTIEKRMLSQVQGRTYVNMFGLVERFTGAKMPELGRDHWLGDQHALEALVRLTDEQIRHQELLRRIDRMMDRWMPEGYLFVPQPNDVAQFVLGKSKWSVLALTCLIKIFKQAHYLEDIEPDAAISPVWKDVFLFHWKEESQHAILDELEWISEDAKLDDASRDEAVDDFLALIASVDGMLQTQARVDADYFRRLCLRRFTPDQKREINSAMLKAYRWQYLVSGLKNQRFNADLMRKVTPAQAERINVAIAPLMA